MEGDFAQISDTMIIFISAIIAAISFAAATLPLLLKNEKRDRYKNIIEKRRKDLFAEAKQQATVKMSADNVSAKDSLTAMFRLQQMMGEFGERVRDRLLMAGVRSPDAPMKYILASLVLPVVGVMLALLFMSKSPDLSGMTRMMIMSGAGLFGYFLPRILVENIGQKRIAEINLTFPDALDMMLICVQGGMGLEQTVNRIAEEISENSPILAEELGILSAEMAMLNDRRIALQDFSRRVGGGAGKSFASALIQAEQYGTSVSQAMKVMSEELRDMRMQTAEQKAASLPPKLTVPMIAFFLPVLFVVILGPAIIQVATG